MKRLLGVAALLIFTLAHPITGYALECDLADVLTKDTAGSAGTQDVPTAIAYLQPLVEGNAELKEVNSFTRAIPRLLDMPGDQQRAYLPEVAKLLKIELNEQVRRTLLIAALSDTAADAYRNCLKSRQQNLFVRLSRDAMSSNTFTMHVELSDAVAASNYPIRLDRLVNIQLVDPASSLIIAPGGKVDVHLRRDPDRPLSLRVAVGRESDQVALPNRPTGELREQTRFADNLTVIGGPDRIIRPSTCVYLRRDDPSIIIPSTVQFVKTASRNLSPDFRATVDPGGTFKNVCISTDVNFGRPDVLVCGYARADVLTVVPPGGTQPKQSSPAYLTDKKLTATCG